MSGRNFLHAPPVAIRGARDYVHSTDLYEEIVTGAAAGGLIVAGPIDLKIIGKIKRRPEYRYLCVKDADNADASAICRFRAGGGTDWTCIIVQSGEPVSARKAYDESPAANLGQIDGRTIAISSETGLRPIEAVTALGVVLHKNVLPPPTGERWMLTQLTLRRPLRASDTRKLIVAIDRVIGQRMTRSSLTAEDGPLGAMVFILACEAKP
jgi:hypothetical protein